MVEFVRKKPFGIAVLMALLGFVGAVGSFACSVILLTSLFGDGPFRMNGEEVTKAEFLRFLIPFSVVYLTGCALALSIAWSIHQGYPRSRPLLLGFSALPLLVVPMAALFGVPLSDVLPSSVPLLVIPVVASIYLYRKDSVVQYYSALRLDRESFPE